MSILEKILSFFSFTSDPKTANLKKIKKEILLETPKYFNPKKNIFYKNFGKDLHYFYKLLTKFHKPLELFISNSKTKIITLKLFLHNIIDKETVVYLNLLEDENINKLVEKYGIKKTHGYYQKIEKILLLKLNNEINNKIDSIFNFLKDLYEISNFNWGTIINKFITDYSSISNKNSKYQYNDVKVTESFITVLEDLTFLLKNFSFNIEYTNFLKLYLQKYYKTKKINFNNSEFKNNIKILQKFFNINFSPFKLEKYLKYIKQDPDYKINLINNPQSNFLTNYLSQKLKLAKIKLQNLISEEKQNNIKKNVEKLFENQELLKSTIYNSEVSSKLQMIDLPKLKYTYAFSITKSFVILYYEAKFKNILSSLIFKANFNDIDLNESLNNSLHECNEFLFKINNFEENLVFLEKLYNIIMKNPNSIKSSKTLKANYSNEIIKINDIAKGTIIEIYNGFKSLYNTLSIIYDDIKNKNANRIKNIINGIDQFYFNNNISSFHKKLNDYIIIIQNLMEIEEI